MGSLRAGIVVIVCVLSAGAHGEPAVRVTGGALEPSIARVVQSHLGELRACYKHALVSRPALFGVLALDLAIDATGSVTRCKQTRSTLKDPELEQCVYEHVTQWSFRSIGPEGTIAAPTFSFTLNPR